MAGVRSVARPNRAAFDKAHGGAGPHPSPLPKGEGASHKASTAPVPSRGRGPPWQVSEKTLPVRRLRREGHRDKRLVLQHQPDPLWGGHCPWSLHMRARPLARFDLIDRSTLTPNRQFGMVSTELRPRFGSSLERELALALTLGEIVEHFLDVARDARDEHSGGCLRNREEGAQLTFDATTHILCLE